MCGICMELTFHPLDSGEIHKKPTPCGEFLQHRGPDGSHSITVQLEQAVLEVQGCVLWLQGQQPTLQPITDGTGNTLLWNGDLLAGLQTADGQSDTQYLSEELSKRSQDEMLALLSAVKGPWSLVYYSRTSSRLYFARDVIGRHSLLWSLRRSRAVLDEARGETNNDHVKSTEGCHNSDNDKQMGEDDTVNNLSSHRSAVESKEDSANSKSCQKLCENRELHDKFVLTSVGNCSDGLEEVPAFGIYYIDLENMFEINSGSTRLAIHLIPWDCVSERNLSGLDVYIARHTIKSPVEHSLNMAVPNQLIESALKLQAEENKTVDELSTLECFDDDICQLSGHLSVSIERRVLACPPCCLRCSSVGHCSHCRVAVLFSGGLDSGVLALLLDKMLPQHEIIDLINVAFPQKVQPAKPNQKNKRRERKTRSNKKPSDNGVVVTDSSKNLIELVASSTACSITNSVRNIHLNDRDSNISVNSCTKKEDHVSSIKPENNMEKCTDVHHKTIACSNIVKPPPPSAVHFDVPDRITGRECHAQLTALCPHRKWNFVEVNVSSSELCRHRHQFIRHLVHPLASVLDDSIGCSLWSAARGAGMVDGQSYTSPARVLLCGQGADEQLCGYSRHRVCFSRFGWSALLSEVSMEVARLHARNMGRDNRVMADHARAPRFPYLDEDVVSYLNSLPIWRKANLLLPRGAGEKLLLRVLAHRLGLTGAAALPKRAIQFGSRIAKMDNRKEKGDQACDRLAGDAESGEQPFNRLAGDAENGEQPCNRLSAAEENVDRAYNRFSSSGKKGD